MARLGGWLQRFLFEKPVAAYLLLAVSVVVGLFLVQRQERQYRGQAAAFTQEAIATDKAFCALANRTFEEINRNRQALRDAYSLLQPPPRATREQVERLRELRERLLRTIDGDLSLLDCSGIGNGRIDFSIQDAIRNSTTTTTRSTP